MFHLVARSRNEPVRRPAIFVPFVLAMVAVVVAVDILFFRHQPGLRLIVNVGIVLVFAALYVRFFKRQ